MKFFPFNISSIETKLSLNTVLFGAEYVSIAHDSVRHGLSRLLQDIIVTERFLFSGFSTTDPNPPVMPFLQSGDTDG